ncbi:spore germination protein PD [Thermolongibacillus altinsuensis]|jgi:spore germination protein PD|uniref:Spore germination protein PD n=1 Tax=Thermolongibacillus altinsuensis TaxID=575256 RepID=A0A4V6NGH5_9BACL|nr:spore gernimation protein GerPD [Thermolongibacillus altinsuensis]TCL51077.1 spore germination protein PD [Thermolongibacillus altinsuensis]GMB08851.1 putative spore germination protein GerPD [Thermolongibacillus altinsuensis]
MNFTVINHDVHVGHIHIIGVTSSSLVLVGDSETIQLASAFDTPPESLIIGPFAPIVVTDEGSKK